MVLAIFGGFTAVFEAGERLVEGLVGFSDLGLDFRAVFTTGVGEFSDLATRGVDLDLGGVDVLLERENPLFDTGELRVGDFVGAGQITVVAQRGDRDEHHYRQREVDAQGNGDLRPVAIKERGRDQLAQFETGGHDHDGGGRTDKEETQAADREVGRATGDE